MFDGMPMAEQLFHQFIAPTRTTTTAPLPLPLPSQHLLSSSFPILHHASPSPNNNNTNSSFLAFDPYNNNNNPSQHQQIPQVFQQHQHSLLFHPLHHKDAQQQQQDQQKDPTFNFQTDHQGQLPDDEELMDSSCSWTNDEVLALLRIRSSMETWFPQFTWDHVSRKLAELGFKKSAEKCKQKFEDESRYFNTNITNCSKNNNNNNFRFLSELEELYQGASTDHQHHNSQNIDNHDVVPTDEKAQQQQQVEDMMGHHALEEGSPMKKQSEEESCDKNIVIVIDDEEKSATIKEKRKRKRRSRSRSRSRSSMRFEMFKGLCERFVNKMMAQQEEIHNKLIQDMIKRDEEKLAREEAWKKQEMEKMNKELEIMAQEQAIAGDRQASIIQFLNNYASSNNNHNSLNSQKDPNHQNNYPSPPPPPPPPNPNPTSTTGESNVLEPTIITPTCSNLIILDHNQIQPFSSTIPGENLSSSTTPQVLPSPSPSSSSTPPNNNSKLQGNNNNNNNNNNSSVVSTLKASSSSNTATITTEHHHQKDDVGRRWPRDEVLALINLRCTILKNNNINNESDKEEGNNNSNNKVVPLWERISQGMAELGYKRSAKRCKEKWENINKYFRKTKDVNKKRSMDSRTCPYFHQLSHLYSQGKLLDASSQKENQENHLFNDQPQLSESSSQLGSAEFSALHHHHLGGEENTPIHTTTSPFNFD